MLTLLLAFSLGGSLGFVAGCVWHSRFASHSRTAEPGGHAGLSIDQLRL